MGHSRRSRSRSRSHSRERKRSSKSKKSDRKKKSSSSSSSVKGGGGSSSRRSNDTREGAGGRSRSRSRQRGAGAGGESSASSRRGRDGSGRERDGNRDRDRDRDRDTERERERDRSRGVHRDDRDRHHRGGGYRDRKGSSRSRSRSRSRGGSRDRKRSRGDSGGGGADELWKRKLEDEDEKLKELDVDALMVDEEEEERRLEEQRRKRKEKLESLQKLKKAEEAAASAVVAAAGATASSNGKTVASTEGGGEDGGNGSDGGGDDDDDDDDDNPIEITKTRHASGDGERSDDGDHGHDDDASGARNQALLPGEGKSNGTGDGVTKKNDLTSAAARAGGEGAEEEEGSSSSELRAQQGKEDRPVFDMFSAAALPAAVGPGVKMGGKGGGAHGMSFLGEDGGGDQGNWTDVEGYYKTRVGEVIGGRYTVLGTVGQGVFSTVLKCLDTRAGPTAVGGGASEVALKMIRNNDTMRKAAQKEVALLKELAEHDPSNKKHCIRLLSSLEHKQHVVMVFESMQMNLRETLKKFGRKTGINIHAVQKYGKQLLSALKHMASRNLVHADIKPDNILVDQGFGSLKLADFGSAFRESDPDNDPTPYLVSRWYRAPEIVLGLDYDKAIDLWSVAVTLFELYKGSPVLPGVNNNEMLKLMMEFKGPVPTRMLKSHMRAFEAMGGLQRPHFTDGGQFMQQEPDPVTGQTTVRLVTVMAPSRPIKGEIMRSKGAQDKRDTVADLADFLDKCMSLDPRQRLSLAQCSAHSFLRRA